MKGELPDTITIKTASNGAACGSTFEIGQEYIVFCDGDIPEKLSTNLCNANIDAQSAEGKAALKSLKISTSPEG